MRSIPRIRLLGLGMIAGTAPVIVQDDNPNIVIQDDPEIDRIIERLDRYVFCEVNSRKQRRRWAKPAKKPKALRGRP